jgi:hypothetical protein
MPKTDIDRGMVQRPPIQRRPGPWKITAMRLPLSRQRRRGILESGPPERCWAGPNSNSRRKRPTDGQSDATSGWRQGAAGHRSSTKRRLPTSKRVAGQTGILTKGAGSSATGVLMSPRIIPISRHHAVGVDAPALYRHIQGMNKLRSAALTTTATAYGGSPAGCAR